MSVSTVDQRLNDDIRLDAWRSVFERLDRILSEQPVRVRLVPEGMAQGRMADIAAWSDGLDIHLNVKKVREMLRTNDALSAVLRLKGLNYHELCHVLYTPRMTDELPRKLMKKVEETGDSKWWYSFNALEDQRIETWFTTKYEATRRYFEATILEWIIREGSAEAAILVYGRKYLTPKLRVQAGRAFVKKYGKKLYDEFKTVIDEYITLVLPTQSVRAMQLVEKYRDLLTQMQQQSNAPLPILVIEDNGGADPHKHDVDLPRGGRVIVKVAERDRDKAQDVVDDAIDADIEAEAEQAAGGKPEGKGDGQGDGQGEGGGKGDGEGEAGQSQGSGQADSQGGDASDGMGDGAGDSGTADHVGSVEDLERMLRDMVNDAHDDLDDVKQDDWIQEDAGRMLDAVNAAEANGRMDAQGANAKRAGAGFAPDEKAKLAVRRVSDILTRIRQEAEPETLRRQYHGRVDGRRMVVRQPHEVDVFKTWDVGTEDEVGIEAVLLCDVSGSMHGRLKEAATAIWALKRSMDKLEIRTTVLMFDTEHSILYQPGDKASRAEIPALSPGGGTNPTSAFKQAQRILTKSSEPNKVLITVTDGHWSGDKAEIAAIMRQLKRIEVHSMLLGLGGARGQYGKHHHDEGHDIENISELPKAVTKLVARLMRSKMV